ncbi:hypothetical protein [Eubacterium sp. An3]|uniref:hypothetical protein n=1 Tax=Eubacterium sp. An3 TaxID=1965628 RepID=UPI0007A7CEB5|nr:hypothetical protein [Eubacterium sp. An3]OUO27207.1 hypothetical protein B5F87_11705 [Eubacterium sp. An3]CVI68891.1 hypothetical protein BN3660_01363 [Eubacteriaceae bacterium CHKCI004]
MKRLEPEIIDYYDNEVVMMISEKYGVSQMEALKMFVCSKTHEMLENEECGMTEFGAEAIFEIWECEKITGDPRNSVYIREE